MEAQARRAFRIGLFAIACASVMFTSVGCQSSSQTAVNPANPMCPICGRTAQAQSSAGLDYGRAVCPICGQTSTVDPDFLDRLEVFLGGPVGDTVYACASCRSIVEQCAVCRQKSGPVASGNTHRWR